MVDFRAWSAGGGRRLLSGLTRSLKLQTSRTRSRSAKEGGVWEESRAHRRAAVGREHHRGIPEGVCMYSVGRLPDLRYNISLWRFIYAYECRVHLFMCVCALWVCSAQSPEVAVRSLRTVSQVVVICPAWVPGTEPRTSAGAANAPNHWAVSLAPSNVYMCMCACMPHAFSDPWSPNRASVPLCWSHQQLGWLGTKLRPAGRPVSISNHWAVSAAPNRCKMKLLCTVEIFKFHFSP